MIGAGLGCVLGPWLPGGDVRLWALVCMAATLGGTMRAPLMAVVFAFELTWDTTALLPTILGCVVAYGFSVVAMPRSILTEKIARRGLMSDERRGGKEGVSTCKSRWFEHH